MKKKILKSVCIAMLVCCCSGCGKQSEVITSDETVVEITSVYSPELERDMVVRIYLPPQYEESDASYPVIYMPDGQNLFDTATASYGKEWCMDETMEELYEMDRTEGVIVVGVDSDAATRNCDYNLYLSSYEHGGEGDAAKVADFFANTLKSYIDENYRTLPEREHTAIIGSSYGAIVSICTTVEYPELYGYTGAFSYCDNQNPARMEEYLKNNITKETFADHKLYFLIAENDFARLSSENAYEIAVENGIDNVGCTLAEGGEHDECTWSEYVDDCLEYFGWIQSE